MKKQWLTADPHFSHKGVTQFLREDGTKLRPWDTIEEMDEALVSNWNSVVAPNDRVYVLGDVVINRKALHIFGRLNGSKVLIKGNHDIFALKDYAPYFDDIRAYKVMRTAEGGKLIMSHIPIHEGSLGRFGLNIHGHLHSDVVMKGRLPDPRYVCVSVEQTNYTPILLEDAIARGVPHA